METKACFHCGEAKPETEWHPSQWERGGAWCRSCYQERHRQHYQPKEGATDDPRTCARCGELYRPQYRIRSVYCSRSCKDRARTPRLVQRQCMHCGAQFTPKRYRAALFCSKRCVNAAHRLQSKLRTRVGEQDRPGVLRTLIAERDRWRCGICQKPVSKTRRYPDPLFGTLDHVVPVTEGGTNDLWNLRLAHMGCNRSRGNRGGNEQLAML